MQSRPSAQHSRRIVDLEAGHGVDEGEVVREPPLRVEFEHRTALEHYQSSCFARYPIANT